MDKKELKSLIKQMVRESLLEVFAEINLSKLVENAVSKKLSNVSRKNVVEAVEDKSQYSLKKQLVEQKETTQDSPSLQEQKQKVREELHKKYGISKDEFQMIYGNIAENNPILTDAKVDDQEKVSESTLLNSGLMRDFSKFLK